MFKCPHCDREFSKMGIKSHIWRVHGDGKLFTPIKPGTREAWNKGKTKATDKRVCLSPEAIRKATNARFGRQLSDETRAKLRKLATQRKINWYGRSTKVEYKGIIFDSSWEANFAKWCDVNQITWIRNEINFPYFWKDSIHSYTPDFWMPKANCFVEIKGLIRDRDLAKWQQFQLSLVVLTGDYLRQIKIIDG